MKEPDRGRERGVRATITIGEELMLLSLDDKSGVAKDGSSVGWTVAGGILADLVLAGRVVVAEGRLTVTDPTPTGEPLLDERLGRLAEWAEETGKDRGRGKGKGNGDSSAKAADWLIQDHHTAVHAAVQRLCERGLVTEQRHRALGLFPVRRYPEADGTAERELRERLAAVVLHGADPDPATAALIALLHAARLHHLAFPELPRKQVEPRFAEIADRDWAGDSVREALRNVQAVFAAITAATVATTTAAVTVVI
ncbi:GPP34 family phosphoprotein [Kitasatospora sp. NPDC097643]|uniref:GOLPH3/VPS74 family protein n=1 Tax=Kitasatospora sp. NPDC097643 TaxID=3157230 RepID=UPI00332CAA77